MPPLTYQKRATPTYADTRAAMKTLRHGGQAHGATVVGRGHHASAPALVVDTDPVDRSDQQSTPTLSLMSHRRREGQSAERIVREKRLVKGTFPHVTPFTEDDR